MFYSFFANYCSVMVNNSICDALHDLVALLPNRATHHISSSELKLLTEDTLISLFPSFNFNLL